MAVVVVKVTVKMPHEVMRGGGNTAHNESDIPEIRVKTAYNGQVSWVIWFFFGSGKENEVAGFVVFSQKLLIGYFMLGKC